MSGRAVKVVRCCFFTVTTYHDARSNRIPAGRQLGLPGKLAPRRMTYEEALAYIASLAPRGWRLGLDRMQEFLRRANLEQTVGPDRGFIHVAGTNGKGSVTAFLQSLMIEQAYRTGAFFSPFVYDPRERVQFGRELISHADLARLTAQLMGPAESLSDTDYGGATEFEFKTALGFKYWAEKGCDWVALEVGLGGRLDATNVVHPRACVIVSIGLDHTSVLGNTLEEIAAEKAGIVKEGVPVMVGEMQPEALSVIEEIAVQHNAPIWRFGREIELLDDGQSYSVRTPLGTFGRLRPGIPGVKQPHNMALAVAAMDAAGAVRDGGAIAKGAAKAVIPGRFERRFIAGKEVILDGAHNPDAARVLHDNLEQHLRGGKVTLVTGMVSGHDPIHFYEPLANLIEAAYVVPVNFHRALPVETLANTLRGLMSDVNGCKNIQAGLQSALKGDHPVLVTGSFYLVGEVGAVLSRMSASPVQPYTVR